MEIKNCWETWKCPDYFREYCPAFKRDSGESDYIFAGVSCPYQNRDLDYYQDSQSDRNADIVL